MSLHKPPSDGYSARRSCPARQGAEALEGCQLTNDVVDHGTPAPFASWVPSGRWDAEVDRRAAPRSWLMTGWCGFTGGC